MGFMAGYFCISFNYLDFYKKAKSFFIFLSKHYRFPTSVVPSRRHYSPEHAILGKRKTWVQWLVACCMTLPSNCWAPFPQWGPHHSGPHRHTHTHLFLGLNSKPSITPLHDWHCCQSTPTTTPLYRLFIRLVQLNCYDNVSTQCLSFHWWVTIVKK